MTPPEFTRNLPQRAAAFDALRRFERENGLPPAELVEAWNGDRAVEVRGVVALDGREYRVGYEWTYASLARNIA